MTARNTEGGSAEAGALTSTVQIVASVNANRERLDIGPEVEFGEPRLDGRYPETMLVLPVRSRDLEFDLTYPLWERQHGTFAFVYDDRAWEMDIREAI